MAAPDRSNAELRAALRDFYEDYAASLDDRCCQSYANLSPVWA